MAKRRTLEEWEQAQAEKKARKAAAGLPEDVNPVSPSPKKRKRAGADQTAHTEAQPKRKRSRKAAPAAEINVDAAMLPPIEAFDSNTLVTRDGWLRNGVLSIIPLLWEKAGLMPPEKWDITVAPTKGKETIGCCFAPSQSLDGTTHIIIDSELDEPVKVLEVILHEMIHACLPFEAKHGPDFKKAMDAVGLIGKPTATTREMGGELDVFLTNLAKNMGPYPHKALVHRRKLKPGVTVDGKGGLVGEGGESISEQEGSETEPTKWTGYFLRFGLPACELADDTKKQDKGPDAIFINLRPKHAARWTKNDELTIVDPTNGRLVKLVLRPGR